MQGLISEEQILLHGSALPRPDLTDLAAAIEDALREDHLPELLELAGDKGWVSEQTGKEIEAWRTDTHILFKSAELDDKLPSSILWIGPNRVFEELEQLTLRDVGCVRYNDDVFVQAMLSKG